MSNRIGYKTLALIAASLGFLTVLPVQAELMIYPAKGQSSEQLSKDRYECHVWAVQQSGFDPTNAQPVQQAQAQHSSPAGQGVRGGVRGAAMGAAVGAIAGDAGKGASIGATAGGIRGGFRHHDQQSNATTPSYSSAPGQDAYNQAIKACLSGRNYSVN